MTVTTLPVNPLALQSIHSRANQIAHNDISQNGIGTVTTFDSRSLNELKLADEQQALQGVAEQFESMFLQMVLKQMRQASEALSNDENNPLFSSRELSTYQEFFDGQLSIEMAKGRLGLAESIVEQLSQRGISEQSAQMTSNPFKETDDTVALYSQEPSTAAAHSTRAFHQPLLLVNESLVNDKESRV